MNFPRVEFVIKHSVLMAESNQGDCDGKIMQHTYLIYLRIVNRLLWNMTGLPTLGLSLRSLKGIACHVLGWICLAWG